MSQAQPPPPPSHPAGPAQQQPQAVYVKPQSSALAILSLICGLLGAAISFIPIVGILGIGLGLLALALGGIGWSKARKGTADGKGMAIAGMILGLIAVIVGVLVLVLIAGAFFQFHWNFPR